MAYKVRTRNRLQSSPKAGLSQTWVEYQVVKGNKIISRHEIKEHAYAEAARLNNEAVVAGAPKFIASRFLGRR